MEKEEIKNLIEKMELSVDFEFVPWSVSRHATQEKKLRDYNLNYKAHVRHRDVSILLTDYMMGQGHCPSYEGGMRTTVFEANKIIRECETGISHKNWNGGIGPLGRKSILPDPVDFWFSIVSDCSVLDYGRFEEWARDLGYDDDSKKAESIYRECLNIALKIQHAIGVSNLEKLREAFQDY